MKKITLFVLLLSLSQLISTAQDSTNLTYDSMVVKTVGGKEIVLGTQYEYREQLGWQTASHKFLCQFIGFKSYWLGNLVLYMNQDLTLSLTKTTYNEKTGTNVFQFENAVGQPQKRTNIKVKIDQDDRIAEMSITGNPYSLMYLFINYWPSTTNVYSKEQLKKGHYFFKYVEKERISFDWTDSNPVIKITRQNGTLGEK